MLVPPVGASAATPVGMPCPTSATASGPVSRRVTVTTLPAANAGPASTTTVAAAASDTRRRLLKSPIVRFLSFRVARREHHGAPNSWALHSRGLADQQGGVIDSDQRVLPSVDVGRMTNDYKWLNLEFAPVPRWPAYRALALVSTRTVTESVRLRCRDRQVYCRSVDYRL